MENTESIPKCFEGYEVFDTYIFSNQLGLITIKLDYFGNETLIQIPLDQVENVVRALRLAKSECK
jgi:hypothetical protein